MESEIGLTFEGFTEFEDSSTLTVDSKGHSWIHYAAFKGNKEEIENALERNLNLNVKDSLKNIPLFYAIAQKQTGIIRLLLKNSDLETSNSLGNFAVHFLAFYDLFEDLIWAIRSLSSKSLHFNVKHETPLHFAAQNNNERSANALIMLDPQLLHIPDSNGHTPLDVAGSELKVWLQKKVEEDLKKDGVVHGAFTCDGCGMEPIRGTRYHCTVCSNYDLCSNCKNHSSIHTTPHEFEVFTEPRYSYVKKSTSVPTNNHNSSYNSTSSSPSSSLKGNLKEDFWQACAKGNEAQVKRFLANNESSELFQSHAETLNTLLHDACSKGDIDVVEILINSSKFNLDQQNGEGETPLMLCVKYEPFHENIAILLVKHGADPTIKDNSGSTPIHLASLNGLARFIASLPQYKKKSYVDVLDKHKNTPLHLAVRKKRTEVIQELEKQGASWDAENEFNEKPKELASTRFLTSINHPNPVKQNAGSLPSSYSTSNSERYTSKMFQTLNLSSLTLKLNWETDIILSSTRLGKGSFGEVWKGKFQGTDVAVKKFLKLEMKQEVIGEIKLLKAASHPNIVQLIGYTVDPVSVVTEFVSNGDLFTYIQANRDMPLLERLSKAKDIVAGLRYLHRNNIAHRDLKTQNLLVAKDGTVKLADFGLAKFMNNTMTMSIKGTPVYMAPETFGPKGFNIMLVDIYALGIILWELFTSKIPFEDFKWSTLNDIIQGVSSGKRPEFPPNFHSQLKKLISECWHHNPSERCSLERLQQELEKLNFN